MGSVTRPLTGRCMAMLVKDILSESLSLVEPASSEDSGRLPPLSVCGAVGTAASSSQLACVRYHSAGADLRDVPDRSDHSDGLQKCSGAQSFLQSLCNKHHKLNPSH